MPFSFYATLLAKKAKEDPKNYGGLLNKNGVLIGSPDWVAMDSKSIKMPERFKLTPTPGKICEHCGTKFWKKKYGPSWEDKRYCNLKCLGLAHLTDSK